ncbi:antitoxin VbhA family protein [Alcaligenes faecalis]|uniref:antitoxin VbhA family protein n=1 Tax=Alcaligenes faecalis TaxID=511 RepID=UPI0013DE46D0|nr:antitoxin VbhA family protein [Alcaligenes faecalis]
MSDGKRREAAEAALASVELEGFGIPEGMQAEGEKYIAGEISFDELMSRLYKQAQHPLSLADQECFAHALLSSVKQNSVLTQAFDRRGELLKAMPASD